MFYMQNLKFEILFLKQEILWDLKPTKCLLTAIGYFSKFLSKIKAVKFWTKIVLYGKQLCILVMSH